MGAAADVKRAWGGCNCDTDSGCYVKPAGAGSQRERREAETLGGEPDATPYPSAPIYNFHVRYVSARLCRYDRTAWCHVSLVRLLPAMGRFEVK